LLEPLSSACKWEPSPVDSLYAAAFQPVDHSQWGRSRWRPNPSFRCNRKFLSCFRENWTTHENHRAQGGRRPRSPFR
jgi:hypothetical protein